MDESALLMRLKRRDEQALKLLYEGLGRNVYSLALELLRNSQEAEEVVQDTFLKLYKNADRYREQAAPRAYVYTVARNLALSRLRKRNARPQVMAGADINHSHYAPAAPVHDVPNKLLVERLLHELKEDEQYLVRQIFLLGFTYAQVSEREDMPLGTVRSKVRRALLKLRDLMESSP